MSCPICDTIAMELNAESIRKRLLKKYQVGAAPGEKRTISNA